MAYYTRVLTKRTECPHVDELVDALHEEHPTMTLRLEEGEAADWSQLVIAHADGREISLVERNVVGPGALGAGELEEFIDELEDAQPASGAEWLSTFLPTVRTIYAFQHLSGTAVDRGDEGLRAVEHHIWGLGDGIIQADREGFTNEDAFHILWQFANDVTGTWWMAVRESDAWLEFQMDLGDPVHREHFLAGRMPPGAKRRDA